MKRTLIIDTPGVKLRAEGKRAVFFAGGKREEIPLDELEEIRICEGASITSDLLARAAERGIVVTVSSLRGEPLALVLPATYGGTCKTRREQIRAYDDWRGLHLAKAFVRAAILSRANLLNRLARNRSGEVKLRLLEAESEIKRHLGELESVEGTLDSARSQLMGIEGRAAQAYFEALDLVIPGEYGFSGQRIRRPPGDPFNAAISFANSRVYGEALKCVIFAGLDPYSGFLHADRPGRASMALDLAEEFIVPASHEAVIPLFTRRQLSREDFEERSGGVYLRGRGRRLLLQRLEAKLNSQVSYRGKTWRLRDAMLGQARAVASFLRGESAEYEPLAVRP